MSIQGFSGCVAAARCSPRHAAFTSLFRPSTARGGSLPSELFIAGMTRALGRDYYVSLLTAAAMHGAAHQAPQVFSPSPAAAGDGERSVLGGECLPDAVAVMVRV